MEVFDGGGRARPQDPDPPTPFRYSPLPHSFHECVRQSPEVDGHTGRMGQGGWIWHCTETRNDGYCHALHCPLPQTGPVGYLSSHCLPRLTLPLRPLAAAASPRLVVPGGSQGGRRTLVQCSPRLGLNMTANEVARCTTKLSASSSRPWGVSYTLANGVAWYCRRRPCSWDKRQSPPERPPLHVAELHLLPQCLPCSRFCSTSCLVGASSLSSWRPRWLSIVRGRVRNVQR